MVQEVFETRATSEGIIGSGDALETVVYISGIQIKQEVAQELVIGIHREGPRKIAVSGQAGNCDPAA